MLPEDAAARGAPGGGGATSDHLSRLPDKALLRVLSHLKAWEAVRTSVLSKRWRHLWASTTRLDIRHPCPSADGADYPRTTEEFAEFVKNLLHRRRQLEPLESLRLCWSHGAGDGGANTWIAYAVRHGAEEIELSGEHHKGYPSPEYTSFLVAGYDFIETRLRILKLIHVRLDGTTLRELSSRCTALEEMELNDCLIPQATKIQSELLRRLTMIKCEIPNGLLSVYAPNLVSLQLSSNFGHVPWIQNLGLLAASNVDQRVNQKYPDCSVPGSCNLEILKLSRVKLDDTTLAQLCLRCPCLEGLELKDCSVEGKEIRSTSLKYLTMISCKFAIGFRVHAPNLVLLRCIKPFQHFPQIQKMEFLVTTAIVLDDSCLLSDCQWPQEEDESDDNSNNGSDGDSDGSSIYYDSDRDRSAPSDEEHNNCTLSYSKIAEDRYRKSKYKINGHKRKRSGDDSVESCDGEYGSKISSDFGGVGMLCSLSHAKRMDLLAHPGEVLLTRELKSITEFKNLKILSLGEWCITPGFDELTSILGHSPNLEKLFLHLDMAYNDRLGCIQSTRSFVCTKLKMVKITCCKHDFMVHSLADFFRDNSMPPEIIFVCRTACSGCLGRKAPGEAHGAKQS